MLTFFRRTRVRLTFVITVVVLAVASVASAAFWTVDYKYEYDTVDETLRSQADVVRQIVAQTPASSELPALPPGNPRGVSIDSIVVDGSGRIVAHDQSDLDAVALVNYGVGTGFPPHALLHSTSVRGVTLRVLLRQVTLPDLSVGGLIIARPIEEMQARLARVGLTLIGGVAALIAVSAALSWLLAGLALRPVRQMSAAARAIGEDNLQQRLESTLPIDDELGELAHTFNAMLGRLDGAFETLQRFTADAAHELRAPLSVMRSQVEVTLRQTRSAAQYRESHQSLLREIQRLSRLADHLLLLSRADAGALTGSFHEFDLPDLLESTVSRWRGMAREASIRLEATIPLDGRIEADQDLIERLVDNLLDNAIRHAAPGGRVQLEASRRNGEWKILVSDDGPGIPTAAKRHLFERFFRSDPARGRANGGAGLGLSLSKAIAELHGGGIGLAEDGPLPGACFEVRLPVGHR